jgi:hypothetical protein
MCRLCSRTTSPRPHINLRARPLSSRYGILPVRKSTTDCGRFHIPRRTCSSSASPLTVPTHWRTSWTRYALPTPFREMSDTFPVVSRSPPLLSQHPPHPRRLQIRPAHQANLHRTPPHAGSHSSHPRARPTGRSTDGSHILRMQFKRIKGRPRSLRACINTAIQAEEESYEVKPNAKGVKVKKAKKRKCTFL